MNFEYPRESVEVVKQANTSVIYLDFHATILTKALENQQFWKTDFGRFLVFWAQIWPKFGPKIGPNKKFELWLSQGVPRSG